MKQFHLDRHVDVSGHSGTGKVAEGVVFGDGKVAMRWLTETATTTATTTVFDSIADVKEIHGHGDATDIVWDDGKTEKLLKAMTNTDLLLQSLSKLIDCTDTLMKQISEGSVDGLNLTREDLGVRHGPKPYIKLPEAK
jgi:hypothetical protein